MPIQTVFCPDCANAITVDIPAGHKATLEHRDRVDLIRVRPWVVSALASHSEQSTTFTLPSDTK